jgi:hypothetical protein
MLKSLDKSDISEDRLKRAEERLASRQNEAKEKSAKDTSLSLDDMKPQSLAEKLFAPNPRNLLETHEDRMRKAEERLASRQNEAKEKSAKDTSLSLDDMKPKSLAEKLFAPNPRNLLETHEDRMKKAEERLEQRQFGKVASEDLARIEMKTGLKLSMELKEGEQGLYRGIHEVAGRSYGLMEKDDGTAKLIPAQQLESRERGHPMHIEKHTRRDGKEQLKGVQHHVRERERDSGLDLSY